MTATRRARRFADHFSPVARRYADHRPGYPAALFDWIADQAAATSVAWDCATGNGQAAVALAERFDRVVASDAGLGQLARRRACAGVRYVAATAEASGLATASVDAVTVAQALHWFAGDRFAAEVRRVLRPGGVVVAWTYPLFRLGADLDVVVERFYTEVVGPYWPRERRSVERRYGDLTLPGEPLVPPPLEIRRHWTLDEVTAYVSTWSAVTRYRAVRGGDPVEVLERDLGPLWGGPTRRRELRWSLAVVAGRIPSAR